MLATNGWKGTVARLAGTAAMMLLGQGLAPARARAEEVAVVRTPLGQIAWRFLSKDAPEHVKYVKHLIATGFYDGTTFHRVIPNFVVQGGDPNSKNDDRSDDGDGEGDRRLKAEFSRRLHYRPGTVGMARDADPDSGSCQFFIALENLPRLDGRYTIFGEVVEGLEVARRIAALPRDLDDNPLRKVPMTVRLEDRELGDRIASVDVGQSGSGEVLTGPGKPRPYDAKNRLWTAPVLLQASTKAEPDLAKERLEVAINTEGRVIDVRFGRIDAPRPDMLMGIAFTMSFAPARYEGHPQKVRIEINADGSDPGPPTGGGAPLDLTASGSGAADGPAGAGSGLTPPRILVQVTLPRGAPPPARAARLRLTVDAAGVVADAALQVSCGDAALDAAAVDAARALLFDPAKRTRAGRKDPEPIAVYLDVETRFVAAAGSAGAADGAAK
jgi:TonB family protein